MKYLSPQQVLAIHDQMIKRFGGSFGTRDIGLLESAVLRCQTSFDDQDLYDGIFEKAAALLQSLLKNHPFVDGNKTSLLLRNKRTALTLAGIFLKINGYRLANTHNEEVKFAIRVDNENLSIEKIATWLKKNSKPATSDIGVLVILISLSDIAVILRR